MNTLKNVISENQTIENLFNQLKNVDGISLTENLKLIKSKTSKQKLLFSISKEIETLKNRDNLFLKTFKKGDSYINKKGETEYYKNDRVENRFHKNPINNIVSFNLKYKGMIIPINNNNQSFSCENNIETLIESYNQYYNIIENLNNNHQLFQLDLFKSKSNK
tara:strand:- start:155 stop:643 length:489 start_codon:yes stop_codon:yes gene_type:complete